MASVFFLLDAGKSGGEDLSSVGIETVELPSVHAGHGSLHLLLA